MAEAEAGHKIDGMLATIDFREGVATVMAHPDQEELKGFLEAWNDPDNQPSLSAYVRLLLEDAGAV